MHSTMQGLRKYFFTGKAQCIHDQKMCLLCKRLLYGPSDTNNAKVHRVSHCYIQAYNAVRPTLGQVLYTSLHTFVTYRSRFVFDFETVLL